MGLAGEGGGGRGGMVLDGGEDGVGGGGTAAGPGMAFTAEELGTKVRGPDGEDEGRGHGERGRERESELSGGYGRRA